MSKISREYQARVTGFEPYIEWKFSNTEFDGFRSPECRLQEAKARYDQFFNKKTRLPRRFFELLGVTRMLAQARRQTDVVRNSPPAKLTWYFMQPISHEYFSRRFLADGLPIESLLHP
ncbi:restriction endonuclease fold toxin 5 domain-containing protein [Paraburkholderia sp. NMBU_R16]|uniref:restriction endonuclease fold toxin 5 domain-containing protein n=1 Tax=Paraburkholderia sp. NMBU_R16 TaxID=2698676 RepID=UPI0020B75C17|nr:restriction endonuclease fold toxin 5 domain-containing protein [Paraburkholderia sp. NMBU_R16]